MRTKIRGTISLLDVSRIPSFFPRRHLSVKELPWCAPTDSPVRRHTRHQQQQPQHDGTTHNNPAAARSTIIKNSKEFKPIDRFGIVAAMCLPSNGKNTTSSGIIGVNGTLPWESLPSDRKIFERLTRNRILIIGRRTLLNERQGNLDHVRHAKHCIVVSKSISSLDKDPRITNNKLLDKDIHILKLARSLDEALDLARDILAEVDGKNDDEKNPESRTQINDHVASENENNGNGNDSKPMIPSLSSSSDNIQCWVAGGERLYEEALKHKSALELHLSVVDVEIDLTSIAVKHVARFPAKYRWDHNYEHISETRPPFVAAAEANQVSKTEPSFVYHIYKRVFRQQ